jgi:membrane associated rhomboid family serine protease
VFVAYRDVTHVVVEPRALAIGTRFGLVLLNRGQLGGEAPARELAEALRARVFALPGGDERRARFARLDAKQRARRPWIAALLAAVTGVVYALQQLVPGFYDAAIYRPPLLALGEWWRYAATQFLHANPAHLLMNAVSALIAGAFVERSLGRAGTLFVAGAAGFGAMYASRFGAYSELLGFSGVAAGFFGALLAIEFFAPAEAPASARIPRMILVIVVALQAALDLLPWLLPRWAAHTAGWAHLGGFAAGALAALLVRDSARALVVLGAAAAVAVSAASFGVVARNLFDPMPALEQRARTMLQGPVVNAMELNNLAWQIATTKAPTPRALEAAAQLAEMAAALTGRSEPTVLDTLAEVYFALGRKDEAIAVIEQAIALAPGDTYYEEQRRRFNGERAADDRPKPPLEQESPTPPDRGAEPGLPPGEIELPPGDEITV